MPPPDHGQGRARRPPRLAPGDTIAVATPAGPVSSPARLTRGADALRSLGFNVAIGTQARTTDPDMRTAEDRAEELNGFLRDPGIRAVVASIGGYNSNSLLPYLDYAALRREPKIICGYSDITALLLACYSCAGVVTFHGPTLLPEIAEYPGMQEYSRSWFLRVTGRPEPAGPLEPAAAWTDEFLAWDLDDNRPRATRPSAGWRWLGHGQACGPLVGGNLETISALAGTPYLPDFTGAVVFLESASSEPGLVERSLAHLDMIGAFRDISAILFGRPFRAGEAFAGQLNALLRRWFTDRAIPVVADVDLGHTDPMLTLPVGVHAVVDFTSQSLVIAGAAVC